MTSRPRMLDAEDRRQHLSRFGARPSLGQESLDLVEKRILVADERQMIVAGQLHEARAGDQARDVAALLDAQAAIAGTMHDQRRHLDRRQDVADVDLRRSSG